MAALSLRVEQLERERDALAARLAAAEARIGELVEARNVAVNRIDWVLDSLHNLLDGRGGGPA